MEQYTLTKPIADIWTSARTMFTRLRGLIGPRQWLYALEALVRNLVLLEALVRAPAAPKLPPLPLRIRQMAPPPPRERTKTCAFRLWPRAKPHPARIRLLGDPRSRGEIMRDALYREQLDRLKQARLTRLPESQRIVRRILALGRALEKPLGQARRFARKLAKASKSMSLSSAPRSPYIDPRVQDDAEMHCWAAARAAYAARYPDSS